MLTYDRGNLVETETGEVAALDPELIVLRKGDVYNHKKGRTLRRESLENVPFNGGNFVKVHELPQNLSSTAMKILFAILNPTNINGSSNQICFGNFVPMDTKDIAELAKIGLRQAQRALKELCECDILKKFPMERKQTYFISPRYVTKNKTAIRKSTLDMFGIDYRRNKTS